MTVQREQSINAMMGGAKAAMGQSPMNMAFGGGAKQLRKDMEEAGSRTWYFSFETAVSFVVCTIHTMSALGCSWGVVRRIQVGSCEQGRGGGSNSLLRLLA